MTLDDIAVNPNFDPKGTQPVDDQPLATIITAALRLGTPNRVPMSGSPLSLHSGGGAGPMVRDFRGDARA